MDVGHADVRICGDFLISVGKGDGLFVWQFRDAVHAEAKTPQLDKVADDETALAVAAEQETAIERPSVERGLRVEVYATGVSLQPRPNFAWSPSAGVFACVTEEGVVLESSSAGRHCLQHHATAVGALCLSEDGLLLASASTDTEVSGYVDICIWHTETQRLTALLQHHKSPIQVASPRRTFVANVSSVAVSGLLPRQRLARVPHLRIASVRRCVGCCLSIACGRCAERSALQGASFSEAPLGTQIHRRGNREDASLGASSGRTSPNRPSWRGTDAGRDPLQLPRRSRPTLLRHRVGETDVSEGKEGNDRQSKAVRSGPG